MPQVSETLSRWIGDSDTRRQLEHFGVQQADLQLDYLRLRADDYYLGLVGELFDFLRADDDTPTEWARLGNALAQFADVARRDELAKFGIDPREILMFAATAFYFGSYPASACLVLRQSQVPHGNGVERALFDLLARPAQFGSEIAHGLITALSQGDEEGLHSFLTTAEVEEQNALLDGPETWIPAKLLLKVLTHFMGCNLRAILPDGYAAFWHPLVNSMLARKPAVFEFFPSQIDAIQAGLLASETSFSLQMPTGAGKTALCETLLFWQATRSPDTVAILLVPYRSLASELRRSVVPRLRQMGISATCSYGGTVPSREEVQALDTTQVLVATPETLAGMLTADASFLGRVSLVICDEGHLLDAPSRGIGLEMLLARFKARPAGPPRFLFISAIVPNIEEINTWLGGTAESVVKSDYRPARAEFAIIRTVRANGNTSVNLVVHPEEAHASYTIPAFLSREDFFWHNAHTGRRNTYSYSSYKTQAVAAARKALTMGGVAIFAANKRGDQGAIGLGEEVLAQLEVPTRLPLPVTYASGPQIAAVSQYLANEYGPEWIGTSLLRAGVILHHGDIPQETREVFESLLRNEHIRLAICTNTLAEGVNLPIRTLVLYSVQRSGADGRPVPLLARDIKNLVGRAGRAGSTTRGLVICANENQWHIVEPVARQQPGENVLGALHVLLRNAQRTLALRNAQLTNDLLEASPPFFSLVDGIDNTLVDLIAEEIGDEQLLLTAQQIAGHTFAATTASEPTKRFLNEIVRFRATRITELRAQGRLGWIKETGARVRTIKQVETGLLPLRQTWDNIPDVMDETFVTAILTWTWSRRETRAAVVETYRIAPDAIPSVQAQVFQIVRLWLAGESYESIARSSGLPVDILLGVLSRVVGFTFQTIVEQGISLLKKLLEEQGRALSPAVERFPDHLKYGLPSLASVTLAAAGVRHRRAAFLLGGTPVLRETNTDDLQLAVYLARSEILAHREDWNDRLGALVFEHTMSDLAE